MRSFVVLALGLTACGSAYTLTRDEAKTATIAATQYAEREGGIFVSCNAQDHNRDGYVVCATKDGFGDNIRLRCTYRAGDRIGCKRS